MNNLKDVNVSFNLRTPKDKSKDSAVKCIIRWNNNTLTLYSVAKINPKHFDTKGHRAKNSGKSKEWDSTMFNERLDDIEGKIKSLFRKYLTEHSEYPSFDEFKEIVENTLSNKKKAKSDSLLDYYETFIESSKTRFNEKTKRLLTPAIIKSYKRTQSILKEFTEHRNRRDLKFNEINLAFYDALSTYMQNELDFSINTIGTHYRNLKTVLNYATEEGINTNLEYKKKSFKAHKVDVDNIYLDIDELKRIEELDLSEYPRLDNARDLFLIGCWTGLRFSDFSKLNKSNFSKDNKYITITAQKTQKPIVIPVHPILKKIMHKYANYTNNSLPKSISNQKLNDYIKEVGKKAELNEVITTKTIKGGKQFTTNTPKHDLITTHTARRSFATNMYVKGAPTISIMQITGHKTESSFLKYIKLESKNHADLILDYFKWYDI